MFHVLRTSSPICYDTVVLDFGGFIVVERINELIELYAKRMFLYRVEKFTLRTLASLRRRVELFVNYRNQCSLPKFSSFE